VADFENLEPLENGWVLQGEDGDGRPVRLSFGETELGRAYLGVVVGRHPALADRVLADPSVSRRHFRVGLAAGAPFVEDLNSLNGTLLEGAALPPFRPVSIAAGQTLACGRVRLTLTPLAGRPAGDPARRPR
jgi:FHA domain